MHQSELLFITTAGRIGRGELWLGAIIVLVASALLNGLLMALGLSVVTTMTGTIQVNGGEPGQWFRQEWSLLPWASLIVSVLTAIPLTIIGVKRRHDRNGSGIDVVAFWVVSILLQLLAIFGLTAGIQSMLDLVMGVWALCLFILLGFLKGTPGPNTYGPDPLARTATA